MQLNREQYKKICEKATPRSKVLRDLIIAFIVGGLICMLGQVLINVYIGIPGVAEKEAKAMATFTLILLSGIATGLGIYDKLSRRAGAGSLVPITGFANAVVSPAMEFKSEGWILGVGAKMFIISGPVIVYGVAASIVAGIICRLLGVI